jgi:hypothetical protein
MKTGERPMLVFFGGLVANARTSAVIDVGRKSGKG